MSTSPLELDVRVIPPRDKHPAIFRAFDGLARGQAMVIVNDHEPRRLREQFTASAQMPSTGPMKRRGRRSGVSESAGAESTGIQDLVDARAEGHKHNGDQPKWERHQGMSAHIIAVRTCR